MKITTILIGLLPLLVVVPFIVKRKTDPTKWKSIAIGFSSAVAIISIAYIISFFVTK